MVHTGLSGFSKKAVLPQASQCLPPHETQSEGTGRFLNSTFLWWKQPSWTLPIQRRNHTTYPGMLADQFSITKALAAQRQEGSSVSHPACNLSNALVQVLAIQPALSTSFGAPLPPCLSTTPSQTMQGPCAPIWEKSCLHQLEVHSSLVQGCRLGMEGRFKILNHTWQHLPEGRLMPGSHGANN